MQIQQLHTLDEIDYMTLAPLLEQVPRAGLLGDRARNYVEKVLAHGFAFVVAEGRKVYGWIAFYANDAVTHAAYLSSLVVHEQLRGQGWGTQLMNRYLAVSKEKGMEAFTLQVLRANEPAIRFYQSLGARIVGPGATEEKYAMRGSLQ